MINIDNSAEKRVFFLKDNISDAYFIKVKSKIIDSIENKNYKKLRRLKHVKYADQFSVYIFFNKIQDKIPIISNHIIRDQLTQIDWFKVLIGSIDEIREIIKNNEHILAARNPLLNDFKQYKEIFEDLYKTELSSNFQRKKEFFELFEDVNVCPYCNRNFINPIYKECSLGGDNKNQSPDIEHFFPKSIYPFLSLSISNLLPSCAFCNKIKSDVDTFKKNCLSPYEIKQDDFKFSFKLKSTKEIEINLVPKNINCQNSKILHLDSLYNEVHSEYINDMFDDVLRHPKSHEDFLKKSFHITDKDYKKVFRNYSKEKDFSKHPLSKLTKDLFMQINKKD